MPEITIKLGDQTLQTVRFDGELLRIGRSRENDIVLENLSVSRDHAHIRLHDGAFILTDLNSANGTLVNGVRITKTEVVDQDIITVGKHKLHFRNPVVASAHVGGDMAEAVRTVMVEPRAEAWLVVESGRLAGREFRITRFETSLGKAATNDIVLTDDWLLAKKQAIILRKGNNAFELQDLGGLRKVKVNGAPIAEKADIVDGNVIELGGTKLCFHTSATQNTPTGRMPKELPPDREPGSEAIREAGSLNGSRRGEQNARKATNPVPTPISEDSIDLEDGFQSIRIALVDESTGAGREVVDKDPTDKHVAVSSEKTDTDPEEAAESSDISDESLPTPLMPVAPPDTAFNHAAVAVQAQVANTVRRPQHQPFEDKRSNARRRRKHHQRAAQKSGVSNGTSNGRQSSVAVPDRPSPAAVQQHSELPKEKEIQMWEEALKNPSPAIQRQAVKILKKLTGKDYEV